MEIGAKYYDGISSKEHRVTLHFSKERVLIKEFERSYLIDEISIAPMVANTPVVISFPNGARAKIEDIKAFEAVLEHIGKKRSFISQLERSSRFALVSIVAIIAFVTFFLTIGAEYSANFLAKILPKGSLDYVSARAFQEIDKNYLHPSNLSLEKKQKIRVLFKEVVGDEPSFRLHFRSAPKLGPNAFALPSGDIVLFDSLVLLDKDKNLRGVAGVLAHEKAHVLYQHALKGTIKASIALALLSYLSGDISLLATALPALLISNGYTREYEKEADIYAKKRLQELHMSTKPLAQLFEGIIDSYMQKREKESNITLPSWLSTHPATKERVKLFTQE